MVTAGTSGRRGQMPSVSRSIRSSSLRPHSPGRFQSRQSSRSSGAISWRRPPWARSRHRGTVQSFGSDARNTLIGNLNHRVSGRQRLPARLFAGWAGRTYPHECMGSTPEKLPGNSKLIPECRFRLNPYCHVRGDEIAFGADETPAGWVGDRPLRVGSKDPEELVEHAAIAP